MFDPTSSTPPTMSSPIALNTAELPFETIERLLDAVQQPIFVLNRAGDIVHANLSAEICYQQPPPWLSRCTSALGAARAPASVQRLALGPINGVRYTAVVIDPLAFDIKDAAEAPWARHWRLAPRHARVAACLLSGHSDKETAAALELSVNSARTYVQQVFHLAGVHNRTDLLRAAIGVSRGDPQREPVSGRAGARR